MPEIQDIRFEPNENPPLPLAFGLAFQLVVLSVSGIILTPLIVMSAGGSSPEFISWAIFVALIICGATTMLQAYPIGRVGSGHILLMGTSGAFIAVCVGALTHGGPAVMCTLICISSILQFFLASRLSMLRRILTPTVSGVVIMLIPVTVFPIVFDLLSATPEGTEEWKTPLVGGLTFLVGTTLAMRAKGMLRLWTPLIGVVVGAIVAYLLGLFDLSKIIESPWVGVPDLAWPGLDLSFSPVFWSLLPAFLFVTVVGMIETIGDSVAIQRVSRRELRAPDYRVVQGAVSTDGVGNLLSGLLGTVPNTTYSSSVAVTELTGVASRRIGLFMGLIFFLIAFIPKFQSLITSLPDPVVGAYLGILIAMLFVVGIKLTVRDGLDFRKAIIVGTSVWVGVGFQYKLIFPDFLASDGVLSAFLQNGMTVGGLVAIVLTMISNVSGTRSVKIKTALETAELPAHNAYLTEAASKWNWDEASTQRLLQTNEEMILTLIESSNDQVAEDESPEVRYVQISAHPDSGAIQLEYIASTAEENLEDRALLVEDADLTEPTSDLSLRIVKHLAADVRHQKYFNTDIVSVRVEPI